MRIVKQHRRKKERIRFETDDMPRTGAVAYKVVKTTDGVVVQRHGSHWICATIEDGKFHDLAVHATEQLAEADARGRMGDVPSSA